MLYFTLEVSCCLANQNHGHIRVMLEYCLLLMSPSYNMQGFQLLLINIVAGICLDTFSVRKFTKPGLTYKHHCPSQSSDQALLKYFVFLHTGI